MISVCCFCRSYFDELGVEIIPPYMIATKVTMHSCLIPSHERCSLFEYVCGTCLFYKRTSCKFTCELFVLCNIL